MDNMDLLVSRNIKRVRVNEAGEYISLDFDDQTLIPRLFDLMKEFERVAETNKQKGVELDSMPENNTAERTEKIAALAKFQLTVCKELKEKVDAAFNDSVCEKVFGNIVPSVSAFAEFFAQLGSLVKRFSGEANTVRNDRIRKYTDKYQKGGAE